LKKHQHKRVKNAKTLTNRKTTSLAKYLLKVGKVNIITVDEKAEIAQKIIAQINWKQKN
jgi:hypothetical protein